MIWVLLFFILLVPSAWASEISMKFHENSGVTLVDGVFVQEVIDTSHFTPTGENDVEIINDLISLIPQPPNPEMPIVQESLKSISKSVLSAWKANAERFWGEELEDLSTFYSIFVSEDDEDIISQFLETETLNSVENVEFVPTPEPAVATPSFEGNQGYLNNDSNGIYARQAWQLAGGRGGGIKIIDVEGAWVVNHEDFPSLFYNSGGFSSDTSWLHHGTAVVGVVGAKNNGIGATGIVSSAGFGVESFAKNSQGFASAITEAALQVGSGGVIIIEVHYSQSSYTPNCTCNLGQCGVVPAEYYTNNYNAIKQAVGNGVVVVEAGGNGSVDLDHSSFNGIFNRSIRDSGAILIGASFSTSRSPKCWTNYGSRIDVHGWGENVVTLSYGDLFNEAGETRDYTDSFSGTSSASPIVAGAAASVQGILKARGKVLLNSIQMRDLLNTTGTVQTGDLARKIGPLPNIINAIENAKTTRLVIMPPILHLLLDGPEPTFVSPGAITR